MGGQHRERGHRLTTVAIHQPQYLPWLPYLAKVAAADTFVFLDDVQFQKNGVQNRNQIKTAQGATWLTVPVRASLSATIAETTTADARWPARHLRAIEQNYARAPWRDEVLSGLQPILSEPTDNLAELNIRVCTWMFNWLGLSARLVRSSQWPSAATREERVIELCRNTHARAYLSGRGASVYQRATHFDEHGISLMYQTWSGKSYEQVHPRAGFIPHLSAIDAFMNLGADGTRALLTACTLPAVPESELPQP